MKIYPTLSSVEEKAVSCESDESTLPTLSTGDLIAPKEGLELEENPHADGYFDSRGIYIRSHGLHWIITGLFVVGDLAGGGLVALPTAMIQSGRLTGRLNIH
jgi:hypothetical protein